MAESYETCLSGDSDNKRLERTRHERASLLSFVGEPLKRSVGLLQGAKLAEVIRSYIV
jgi:hypothetical protein